MWTLKEPVRIVLKKHGVVITRDALERDQTLANLILNDEDLNKRYGHNLKQIGKVEKPVTTIPVSAKKKIEPLPPETSQESLSTSTAAQPGGMTLNIREVGQPSQSQGSKQSKPQTVNQSSQKRKSGV